MASTQRIGRAGHELELAGARRRRGAIGHVEDDAAGRPLDGGVRLVDEAGQSLRQPVVAAGQAADRAHALLDDGPAAVGGHDEAVQVEGEAVLHGRAVHLGDEAAGAGEGVAVEAGALADGRELGRRAARRAAAAAAHVHAQLGGGRRQAALEGAEHACRDAGGVPVHSHDGAEGLEPEGMSQAAQELVAPVLEDDGLGDDAPEASHAAGQPRRHAPAMERQIGASTRPHDRGSVIRRSVRCRTTS